MLIDNPPGLAEQVADESMQVCECGFIILQIRADEKRFLAHCTLRMVCLILSSCDVVGG